MKKLNAIGYSFGLSPNNCCFQSDNKLILMINYKKLCFYTTDSDISFMENQKLSLNKELNKIRLLGAVFS